MRVLARLLWTTRWLWPALGLGGLAAIPTQWLDHGPAVCLFKALFGVECFGCGMTRALSALLHGDLAVAVAYNKLVFVVFPALAAFVLCAKRRHRPTCRQTTKNDRLPRRAA